MDGTGRWQTFARRLLTIPVFALLFAAALASAPLWLPLAAFVDLLRGERSALLRCGVFLVVYLGAELAGLLAAAGLWLLRPLARWDAARWQQLHWRLQDWWGATLFSALVRCFALRVEVSGVREVRLGDGPYLLLIRHTSACDTLLASVLIGRPHGMRLRYVLKRELLWDPCLDVVGRRLPHCFVERGSDDAAAQIAEVQALARGLSRHDGVLIYPEGTRYTGDKRDQVLARLAREGRTKLLEYASGLRCVLPPRMGGTLGLLEAAPESDVVVCVHTGFEGAASLREIANGALWRRTLYVAFERVPRARIPRDRDLRVQWLRDLWCDVDAWVNEHAASQLSCARALSSAVRAAGS